MNDLEPTTCVVCGECIWWEGDLPPACDKHTYGEVLEIFDALPAEEQA